MSHSDLLSVSKTDESACAENLLSTNTATETGVTDHHKSPVNHDRSWSIKRNVTSVGSSKFIYHKLCISSAFSKIVVAQND